MRHRIVRIPELGCRRDLDLDRQSGCALRLSYHLRSIVVEDGEIAERGRLRRLLQGCRGGGGRGQLDSHGNCHHVQAGLLNLNILDVFLWHRLHPNGLPDPGGGGVNNRPQLSWIRQHAHALLASELWPGLGWVEDVHQQLVRDGVVCVERQRRSNVGGEAIVAAGVIGHEQLVDVHLCLPVDGTKVQQRLLLRAGRRAAIECQAVP